MPLEHNLQTLVTTYPALAAKCTKARLVLPKDLIHRRLCIVGESLGAEEEAQGEYFIGKAGKLLDKLLSDLGLIRESIHITNVIKVRPPNNDMDRLHELGLSINDFLPYLKEELSIVQPVAILALGRYALEALTSEHGITKWRGSTLPCTLYPSATVVPTLHPSYLQRGQMDQYPYVRNDIKRFGQVGFGTYKPEDPYDYIINPTLTQAIDFLNEILNHANETCFDIETVAHQRITCIGWTLNPNSAICIPFRHNGLHNRWSEAEQIILVRLMQQLFAKPGLVKIGQSMHYDMHFLLPLLGFPREPLFDTRYAHQLIHSDTKHDLGFLTSIYTNMNYHKDEFKDWAVKSHPHDETLWTYNIKDVITTHRIYHGIIKDLKELNLYDFFTGFVMPFRRVVFEMEHRGIRVDTQLHTEWKDFIEQEELPIAQDILIKMAGQTINPNSPKQISEYLHDVLSLPVPRTKAGNYSVDDKVLKSLRARYPQHRDIIDQILCVRVLKAKDLGTYLSARLSPEGRMLCSYGYTKTGRLTSSTNHQDCGTNVQNIPKHLRQIFIPEEGHVFIDADLSQAEVRVMAYLIHSDKLKDVFKSGKKIHRVVGSWIYNKPEDSLTPEEYLLAKKTVHGSDYKMGVNKFATIIGKPVAEARALQERYYTVVPELPAYFQAIQQTIETTRKLTTCYGRTRIFTGRLDDETFRSGYAQIPQSTVVDTINVGTLSVWLLKPAEIYIATQTHDSILSSCPPELVEAYSKLLTIHLETLRELPIGGEILTIPLEIEPPKDNWYGK